jgi:hypothetical protein
LGYEHWDEFSHTQQRTSLHEPHAEGLSRQRSKCGAASDLALTNALWRCEDRTLLVLEWTFRDQAGGRACAGFGVELFDKIVDRRTAGLWAAYTISRPPPSDTLAT